MNRRDTRPCNFGDSILQRPRSNLHSLKLDPTFARTSACRACGRRTSCKHYSRNHKAFWGSCHCRDHHHTEPSMPHPFCYNAPPRWPSLEFLFRPPLSHLRLHLHPISAKTALLRFPERLQTPPGQRHSAGRPLQSAPAVPPLWTLMSEAVVSPHLCWRTPG